jgi:hypothetical protein
MPAGFITRRVTIIVLSGAQPRGAGGTFDQYIVIEEFFSRWRERPDLNMA